MATALESIRCTYVERIILEPNLEKRVELAARYLEAKKRVDGDDTDKMDMEFILFRCHSICLDAARKGDYAKLAQELPKLDPFSGTTFGFLPADYRSFVGRLHLLVAQNFEGLFYAIRKDYKEIIARIRGHYEAVARLCEGDSALQQLAQQWLVYLYVRDGDYKKASQYAIERLRQGDTNEAYIDVIVRKVFQKWSEDKKATLESIFEVPMLSRVGDTTAEVSIVSKGVFTEEAFPPKVVVGLLKAVYKMGELYFADKKIVEAVSLLEFVHKKFTDTFLDKLRARCMSHTLSQAVNGNLKPSDITFFDTIAVEYKNAVISPLLQLYIFLARSQPDNATEYYHRYHELYTTSSNGKESGINRRFDVEASLFLARDAFTRAEYKEALGQYLTVYTALRRSQSSEDQELLLSSGLVPALLFCYYKEDPGNERPVSRAYLSTVADGVQGTSDEILAKLVLDLYDARNQGISLRSRKRRINHFGYDPLECNIPALTVFQDEIRYLMNEKLTE